MDKPKRKQIRLPEYDYSSTGAYFVTICTHEKRRILSDVTVGATHESPAAGVQLTAAGNVVLQVLQSLPHRFPELQIDHYVIMPNHVHLLLRITEERALREAPLQTRADSSESLVGAVHERPVQGGLTGGTIPGESDDCYSRALREAPLQTRADSSESFVGAVHERPVQGEVTGRTIPGESDDCHRRALREAPLQDKRSLLSKAVGFLKMNSSKQIHMIYPDLTVWQRSYYEHIIRNEQDYREIWKYIEGNPGKWAEDMYYF